MFRFNIKRRILWRVFILRRCFRSLRNQILTYMIGKSVQYKKLPSTTVSSPSPPVNAESSFGSVDMESDLVALKISLLGDENYQNSVAIACKDSVAMFFMFDLTSRCTLNSVIRWYKEARKWNQTAIPILIGTKFDDFVQLPMNLQWTIASQARAYAKALNATLFFSSANYNINVNKIFKFITAKLFNLPWTLERNLTIGEPIIDF
ncbi:hypothetical protein F0562_008300 [Nyssa sinensis]|uniref:Septum-promoting GTP-binding protein 1 n=1 Tax=Nyssa sinensis TaxID=561372 RepID=A0A5J5AAM9_9ASTE|nr:hypothetical protein F0562_008300 [Nyssa sinensis]